MAGSDVQTDSSGTLLAPEGQLSRLVREVMFLATYSVEQGRLPPEVSLPDLYRMWQHKIDQGKPLGDDDILKLGEYYRILEDELAPVTAASLKATNCVGLADCMKTDAGRHVYGMWAFTSLVIVLVVLINIAEYTYNLVVPLWAADWPEGVSMMAFLVWLGVKITPFTYGALGSCAHVLRVTEQRLRDRTFDARRIPQHRNRLVLGTLSGGVIVMFVTPDDPNLGGQFTAAALGFLAGYSIDFLFAILDRVLHAVVPAKPEYVHTDTPEKAEAKPRTMAEKPSAAASTANARNVVSHPAQEGSRLKPVMRSETPNPPPADA